jgi:hypothetical protein
LVERDYGWKVEDGRQTIRKSDNEIIRVKLEGSRGITPLELTGAIPSHPTSNGARRIMY